MLIDCHTHIQGSPAQAADFLRFLGREPDAGLATLAHARAEMSAAGVDRVLIVPWLPGRLFVDQRIARGMAPAAARAEVLQTWSVYNRWAARAARAEPERVFSLVGVDPLLMGDTLVGRMIDECLTAGAVGIKISPMFVGVPFDHPAFRIVWQRALAHDVPVLVEAESTGFQGGPGWGDPVALWSVMAEFPELRLQVAHLSRGSEQVVVALAARYRGIHADLAQRLASGRADQWPAARIAAKIREIGVDRVLYGTNYPLVDMRASAAAFAELPLSGEEAAAVAADNALRLFGLG